VFHTQSVTQLELFEFEKKRWFDWNRILWTTLKKQN